MPVIFYDLETFGLSPRGDRIAEFAGILTDDRLDLLEQPYELRALPPPDYLASPGACLTTGITPQAAMQTGLPEPDFARRVYRWFTAAPETVILGYNNAAFDDEFIRHLFYRTFLDPYEWQYLQGNRRMDMLTLMPGLFDFHRDRLVWPRTETGEPDFRLEAIAAANDALGGTSHEALADTFALRNVTRLIMERIPEVWDAVAGFFDRKAIEGRLWTAYRSGPCAGTRSGAAGQRLSNPASPAHPERPGHDEPPAQPAHPAPPAPSGFPTGSDSFEGLVVFASPRIRTVDRASSIFLVIGREDRGGGQWWLWNLDRCPEALLAEEPEHLASMWYSPDRPEVSRALQRINPRRFPFVIPAGARQRAVLERYGLTEETVDGNLRRAVAGGIHSWASRFLTAMTSTAERAPEALDVDGRLYEGFPPDRDRAALRHLQDATTTGIADQLGSIEFSDPRYRELVNRFFGRYVPQRMTSEQRRLFREDAISRIDIDGFDREWHEAREAMRTGTLTSGLPAQRRRRVIDELKEHRNGVVRRYGLEERYPPLL
ncbi:MAG: exonuclease domain-containing protein [Alkalispirochaeta sp.]